MERWLVNEKGSFCKNQFVETSILASINEMNNGTGSEKSARPLRAYLRAYLATDVE